MVNRVVIQRTVEKELASTANPYAENVLGSTQKAGDSEQSVLIAKASPWSYKLFRSEQIGSSLAMIAEIQNLPGLGRGFKGTQRPLNPRRCNCTTRRQPHSRYSRRSVFPSAFPNPFRAMLFDRFGVVWRKQTGQSACVADSRRSNSPSAGANANMRDRSNSVSSRSQHHAQPKVLSHQMEEELTKAEAMIEKGFKSFVQTGTELERIRDSKLYRGSYKSWAAYTRQRWNMSKTHANRLIAAARLALDKLTPSGVNFQSEHELRSLIKLTNSQFENALAKARKVATEKKAPLTVALLVKLAAKHLRKRVIAYRRGGPIRIGADDIAKRNNEFSKRIRPVLTAGKKLAARIATAIKRADDGTDTSLLQKVHDFLGRLDGITC